jgi:hypothetical protein
MKQFTLILIWIICASCLFNNQSVIEEIHITAGGFDRNGHSHIIIDAITIKKDIDSDVIRENAAYILELLKEKYDCHKKSTINMAGNLSQTLHTIVSVKENSYMKGYESFNTVTIEMICFKGEDHTGEPVIIALFSEDTKETISSYRYLYSILERIFKKIFY